MRSIRTRNDSAQEKTLVVSATMRINVEQQCNRPLLLQNRRCKAMGKIFDRKSSQRLESCWEEIYVSGKVHEPDM